LLPSALHILQVTPTSYARDGVIGGGEKLALYLDAALRVAADGASKPITTALLALDATSDVGGGRDHRQALAGRAWDPYSVSATDLRRRLDTADIVYVHQCLTPIGLFVAAHARLLGKQLFGSDAGAGEAALLKGDPDALSIYDGLHAISAFAAAAYREFLVPVHVIPGPVDTDAFPPGDSGARDPSLVVSVGRVLPHKGYERTIRALPEPMRLVIVGQHYDAEYLAFLRDLAVGRRVEFLADLDDGALGALLARAGLFVHASVHVGWQGQFYHKPELLGLAPLEALSTGLTTLVGNAGALGELGVLPGCHVFETDGQLADLLRATSQGTLPLVPSAAMHEAVTQRYGLASVGARLLHMMDGTLPCAS
jgi:glycosyltransferase involved in cell wall biosynthesis